MGGFKKRYADGGDYMKMRTEHVCRNHFTDQTINEFIGKNATQTPCSYCGNTSAAPLQKVLELIDEGINIDYEDVYSGNAIWDDEKEEFMVETFDSDDLLRYEIGLDANSTDLMNDVIKHFSGTQYCETNPYNQKPDQELAYNWRYFSHLVKYKTRFTFFYPAKRTNSYGSEEIFIPSEILQDVGDAINDLKLYSSISAPLFSTFTLFRARQHGIAEKIDHHSKIGPAPKEMAKANRFSPAGIPMFYGSEDGKTAISEVIDKQYPDDNLTIGRFITVNEMNLVDLTTLPRISIFDREKNQYIPALRFLQEFILEISRPVGKGNAEHIDYVPSQIITEYLRYIMPERFHIPINGIKYNSIKCPGKVCYVMFFDEENITQDDGTFDKSKALALEIGSLVTKAVKDW